jgi:hypothetical protein
MSKVVDQILTMEIHIMYGSQCSVFGEQSGNGEIFSWYFNLLPPTTIPLMLHIHLSLPTNCEDGLTSQHNIINSALS